MRTPRVLVSLVAAAVVSSVALVAPGMEAVAASPTSGGSAAAPTRSPAGHESYERPDLTSADLAARLLQHRVEVTSLRTETNTTWANPDGTLTTVESATPVRVRADGAWVDVDTTLVRAPGGYAPRAAKLRPVFSGGGLDALSAVTEGRRVVKAKWRARLPRPEVRGDTATYRNVEPGVDIVETAGVVGFEMSVVLKRRPPAGQRVSFELPLAASGLSVSQEPDGSLRYLDGAGRVVMASGAPVMWGAARDPHSDEPTRVAPVASQLSQTASGPVLTITPDPAFLADPSVTYPVTIDPPTSISEANYTYINSAQPTFPHYNNLESENGVTGITRVGTYNGGGDRNRAFYQFNSSLFAGASVISATLNVHESWSYSCSPEEVDVWDSANFTSSSTWNNPPTVYSKWASATVAKGYSSSCPAGTVSFNITPLAQSWARNAADGTPNHQKASLALRSPNETNNFYWKKFAGTDATVTLTYNGVPSTPAGRTTMPCDGGYCGQNNSMVFTDSPTPTLAASSADSAGNQVQMAFEVWQGTSSSPSTRVANAQTGWVSSGQSVSWKVSPALADGVYEWRARAWNGVVWGPYSSWVHFTVDTTAPGYVTFLQNSTPSGYTTRNSGEIWWTDGEADIVGFLCLFDGGFCSPDPSGSPTYGYVADPSGTSHVVISGASGGEHRLDVGAIDKAGNVGSDSTYGFTVGGGVLASPADQARTQQSVDLAGRAPDSDDWVDYYYRQGTTGSFQLVPIGDLTVTGSGGDALPSDTAWPLQKSAYPQGVTWNVQSSVGSDGLVQVQACFYASQSRSSPSCSSISDVQLTTHAFADSDATRSIGPGTLALLTGDYAVPATDVSVASYKGSLSFGRTFTTLAPTTSPGAPGVLGHGWRAAFYGPNAGHAEATLVDNSARGYVTLVDPDGTEELYKGSASTYSGVSDTAAYGSTLTKGTSADGSPQFTLKDRAGTQTVYTKTASGVWATSKVVQASGTAAATTTTYTLDGQGRVTQMIAPAPEGVTCAAPLATTGCRTLSFDYATSTTATADAFGDYAGQLASVSFTAYDPATSAMRTLVVARYGYDAAGLLRQEWDPRITPNLVTTYGYDADGRLSTITPPGLAASTLSYDAKGRLVAVSHPDPSGVSATTTIVYDVPAGSGGPIDLSSSVTSAWGQATTTPTAAVAIFPPDHVPAAPVASADWPFAQLVYIDVNGREVNTAAYGDGAWQVGATQYDKFGNPVWSITPSNLAQAIAPTAATDPAVAAMTSEKDRAEALATRNGYSADGTELVWTLGPAHPVTLANGTRIDGRDHVVNTYDQGAPSSGGPYRLVTTSVRSVRHVAATTDYDAVTTQIGYAALVAGDVTGWVVRQPTSVTTLGSSGASITHRTRYNDAGQVIESRQPMAGTDSSGVGDDAYTTVTTYYTASGSGPCVSPGLAGLVCSVGPAAQPTTGKPLPTTTTTYNLYSQPVAVTEVAGPATRTTTTSYDDAGRVTGVQVVVAPAGAAGAEVPQRSFGYDTTTGLPTTVSDASGTITTGYDNLARVVSYADASGATTSTSYDIDGRVLSVTDPKGTTTYAYDGVAGEHRGLLTGLTDSVAGSFAGGYDADGRLATQTYPGGLVATYAYDNTGAALSVEYAKDGVSWLDFSVARDAQGRVASANDASGAVTDYDYDSAGRLTSAVDNTGATCLARVYGYNGDSDRLSLASSSFAPTGGACAGVGTPTTVTHSYDQADRVIDAGYSYDDFGRTLTLPGADAGGGSVTLGYYTNDLVHTMTGDLGGQLATKTFGLDPAGRIASQTTASASTFAVSGIAAGWYHSLAIDTDGAVWAWGRGTNGELGNGTTSSSDVPAQVGGVSGVVQVSGGYSFSVALKDDGTVWAWGYNLQGELGNDSTAASSTPVQVAGLTGVTQIATGAYSTLALKSDGTVWAWGRNNDGQLGDGTTTDHHTPIQVPGLSNVVAVSGAGYTSAALTADGSVWVWGRNNYGQLGDGTTTSVHTPQKVAGLPAIVALSVGYNHVAAVSATGQVWGWGFNGDGEVGDGTTTTRLTPVQLSGLSGIIQVAAGIGHTLALTSSGSVFAWGYGGAGEIGTGSTANALSPTQVPGLSGVTQVAAGQLHSLAMASDGGLWVWGGDNYGQLGDGATTNALTVERLGAVGQPAVLTDHYDGPADSPTWTTNSDGGWTRNVAGLDGNLDAIVAYDPSTGTTATTLQLIDLHGDVAAAAKPNGTGLAATYAYDEFGNSAGANELRYGWLGAKARPQAGIGGLSLMGVRVYNPATGRFLQTDPISGASCNPYDYACQDPVNGSDLSGTDPEGDAANRIGATRAEIRWCMVPSRLSMCSNIYVYARWAEQAQVALFGPASVKYRSYGDAFRHVLWIGLVTWRYGAEQGIAAGRRHEDVPGNTGAAMAYWNNTWGAFFGSIARGMGLNEQDAYLWIARRALAWLKTPFAYVPDRIHDPS